MSDSPKIGLTLPTPTLLTEANAPWRAMLDVMPARALMFDRQHRLIYINQEALDYMRASAAQVLGHHLRDLVGESYANVYEPLHKRIFESGESVRQEGWVQYPEGKRYVQEHFLPYRGELAGPAAPVLAVFAFVRDLTPLKRREAELAARVAELQSTQTLKAAIVDNALNAIVSADAQSGAVMEFNPAAERMFGYARADVLGVPVRDLIVPVNRREGLDAGLRGLQDGAPPRLLGRRVEIMAMRASGEEFPVEMAVWRTQVEGRAIVTASLSDLTEKRDAAQQIARQREALRQSEKLTAMGSLLAGVAHELNNPLAIVMGRASLLEEKAAGSALASDAKSIREAAERCGRIVRTFLNMARQKPAERVPLSLNDLVRGAVDLLQYSLRTSGLTVEMTLARDLPAVLADGDRIGQIVLNLIVNAQQALVAASAVDAELGAGAKQRVLRLTTGVESPRSEPMQRAVRVWLQVADNGPGVPEALRERIFDPYFTTKRDNKSGHDDSAGGTGLGLAVSRAVAHEHGGELRLEASSTGASFRLSLPISGQPMVDTEAMPLASADSPAVARILVVDDESEIADLMRAMLESAGFDVAIAESGAVALELLSGSSFDAVVSDLRMPDMDGAALWRAVHERAPALARRMLFVTGDTLSLGAQRFLAQAHCESLDKPFSKADLLARLQAVLQG